MSQPPLLNINIKFRINSINTQPFSKPLCGTPNIVLETIIRPAKLGKGHILTYKSVQNLRYPENPHCGKFHFNRYPDTS